MYDQIMLECLNGFTLIAKGGNLIIRTKKADETIPISSVSSFTYKQPGAITSGSVVFKVNHPNSIGLNIGLGIGLGIGSEKTFYFVKKEAPTAQRIKDYVAQYREQPKAESASASTQSVSDELRSLKALLDDGILTQEEFNAKKKQLLNL